MKQEKRKHENICAFWLIVLIASTPAIFVTLATLFGEGP